MKNILITAGPTNEYIDEVMKITNMSTGRLGLNLANYFLESGDNVTLVATRSVFRNSLYERFNLANNPKLKGIPIETTDDMYLALEQESKHSYDLVIHSAAVGDYKPEFTFTMESLANELVEAIAAGKTTQEEILAILTNPESKVDDDTKISSYEPHLAVKLTLTPKLISNLRKWYVDATLVGFKLLENVPKEQLMEVAQRLCIKNDMDYIIANDLADLRQGTHLSFLVGKDGFEGTTFHSPEDIFVKTKSFTQKKD